MSYKLTINVTKEVLKQSAFCCSPITENCAIALVIRDIFPDAHVTHNVVCFIPGFSVSTLPAQAKIFVLNFDLASPQHRMDMQPISFDIDIPEDVIETIDITSLHDLLQGKYETMLLTQTS